MPDELVDKPAIQEFKGLPVLALNPNARFIVSFGVNKAKLILANFDAIKKFVETNGEECS